MGWGWQCGGHGFESRMLHRKKRIYAGINRPHKSSLFVETFRIQNTAEKRKTAYFPYFTSASTISGKIIYPPLRL